MANRATPVSWSVARTSPTGSGFPDDSDHPTSGTPDTRAPVLELPGILDHVVNEARDRRAAIRQLAELRRRLEAAEGALTDALAASKRAEEAFDAASDRFDAAERVLDEAREDRAQARRDRYAARQAYERARATADRLARRVRETSERLDRAAELPADGD